MAWHFIAQGIPVVYESASLGLTYVISGSGEVTTVHGTADKASVPALNNTNVVHIFDAVAGGHREPVLLVFSSRNPNSYRQTERLPLMSRYCIPSYDVQELENFCDLFDVDSDEVWHRCAQIGPSIRYVLVNDYATTWTNTLTTVRAQRPRIEDLNRYIDDCHTASGTPVGELSAVGAREGV